MKRERSDVVREVNGNDKKYRVDSALEPMTFRTVIWYLQLERVSKNSRELY